MADHHLLQISGDCPFVVLSAIWVWLGDVDLRNNLRDNAREISTGSQHRECQHLWFLHLDLENPQQTPTSEHGFLFFCGGVSENGGHYALYHVLHYYFTNACTSWDTSGNWNIGQKISRWDRHMDSDWPKDIKRKEPWLVTLELFWRTWCHGLKLD